jgi:hypothetical protein
MSAPTGDQSNCRFSNRLAPQSGGSKRYRQQPDEYHDADGPLTRFHALRHVFHVEHSTSAVPMGDNSTGGRID